MKLLALILTIALAAGTLHIEEGWMTDRGG